MPKEIAKKKVATKKVAAPAPAKKAAAPVKAKVEAPKKAPARKPTAPKAPKAPAKPAATKTTIVAKYDAGFGNSLYLRGEGAGLSWDTGVLMTCVAADEWIYTVENSRKPLAVKVLINDTTWSAGPNIDVPVGETVVFTPSF